MKQRRCLIAAPGSSSGKTTVTLLLAALARRRGLAVQGFKCGPDFIDPQYLSAVTSRPTPSLDAWFLAPAVLRRHYNAYAAGADFVLAEGVMGLFDGKRDAPFGRYSSAEVARTLKLPLLLVLNARKAGPTLATQALGLMKADPRLKFAGVILNECMGAKSVAMIAPALKKLCGLKVLGWLPPMAGLKFPERHLGLTAPSEMQGWQQRLEAALPEVEKTLPLKAVLAALKPVPAPALKAPATRARRFTLAVAKDAAFHFYYPETLDLLAALGAEIKFFSPLNDKALPAGAQGLLVGGGFPEQFGAALQANAALRDEVKKAVQGGLPTWAECGGLMWLAETLTDAEGKAYAMVGALTASTQMTSRLQHFGYTEAKAGKGHAFLPAGLRLKGHEFHHSVLTGNPVSAWQLLQSGRDTRAEGWRLPQGVASYFHAYLPAAPGAARAFAKACLQRNPKP
jgi:cobyrinic acid a,c-diamide synthase